MLKRKWRSSIEFKLMIGFGFVIVILMISSFIMYHSAVALSKRLTYEKMYSQAEYYLRTLDQEIGHIRQLQRDFFNDRKLIFLVGPDMNTSAYEKRDSLLSVMERVNTVEGVSSLIQESVLYLPKSRYRITSSEVRGMSQEDESAVGGYLNYLDSDIHYDGSSFLMVEAGAPKIGQHSKPNHILVIRFSIQQLRQNLAALSSVEGSGAFLFYPEDQVFVETDPEGRVGEEIMGQLDRDEEGNYFSTQRVKVKGEHYLVFVGGEGALGTFVEYQKEASIMEPINRFRNMVYFLFVIMFLAAVLFGIYFKGILHYPMDVLLKAFQRIQEGNWKEHIQHKRQDEFCYLYDGFNQMEDQMGKMIEQVYEQTNLAQRSQMKQLQAQIAPHFLYNSFFSLSSKIKRGDYENAQELAMHLGDYFKYLTKNESDYVSLRQEVDHAGSYAAIQGTRFIHRITINFEEMPEQFQWITVPRLILQPLLENAFEYGLENKMKDGILWVHFAESEEEYQVLVEDNGDTSDSKLEEMREGLKEKKAESSGIYNIHRRLQIFYHNRAGLRVQRSTIGGICVMIYLNKGEIADESKFTDC